MAEHEDQCNCIRTVDKDLETRGYNAACLTNLFGPARAVISLWAPKKIRGSKLPILQATYCPFCGIKYERILEPEGLTPIGEQS